MQICVCFKIVPEFDKVLESDWENISQGLDTSYVKKMINCFDETALEMALRIKEMATDMKIECTAVTVGGGLTNLMKGLYAVGYDKVVNIPFENREFCSKSVAKLLTNFIKDGNFDLILLGKQAGMADSGMVPPLVAELLNLPFVKEVVSAEIKNSYIMIKNETLRGIETLELTSPVVASVGNAEYSYLRIATLRDKMIASKRDIEEFSATPVDEIELPIFIHESSNKDCIMVEGENESIKADYVYKKLIERLI